MSTARIARAVVAAATGMLMAAPATAAPGDGHGTAFCAADPSPPEYYAFPLVTTKNVHGTAATEGTAEVHFGSTPFGITLASDGSFLYQLDLSFRRLPEPRDGAYVAWVTTPSLDRIERVGTVGADGTVEGTVRWNKFLVVITLEPESAVAAADNGGNGDDDGGGSWTGPIVLRGMSKSGMMHTMAGHGPFQQENCAAYGF